MSKGNEFIKKFYALWEETDFKRLFLCAPEFSHIEIENLFYMPKGHPENCD